MTPTDVHFDGIVTADSSKRVCVRALSNTFPRSLKHDGTASEQRHCLYCETGTSV